MHAVVQLRHARASDVAPVMEASLGKRTAESAIQVWPTADQPPDLIGPSAVRQRWPSWHAVSIFLPRRLRTMPG